MIQVKIIAEDEDRSAEIARGIIARGEGETSDYRVLAEICRQLREQGREDVVFYRAEGSYPMEWDLLTMECVIEQQVECRPKRG